MKNLFKSFKHAGNGIYHILRSERNARVHLVMAALAFTLGVVLGVSNTELAAIFFAVIIVFVAEVTNTALEKTLDLISANHHPQIKIVKDMAAGAVMIASIAAFLVGIAIFMPYFLEVLWQLT